MKYSTLMKLTIFASLSLYGFKYFPQSEQLYKLIFYCSVFFSFILKTKKKSIPHNNSINLAIKLLILIFICSILNAALFEQQNIIWGGITTIPYILSYSYIFILWKQNPTTKEIEDTIRFFAFTYIILMAINFLMGDNTLFGSSTFDHSRNAVRYRLGGISWLVLYQLLTLQNYIEYKEKKYLYTTILCFCFIFLSLTRQTILLSIICSLLLLLILNKGKKTIVTICIFIGALSIILPKIPAFNAMYELTVKQKEDENENIRLFTWLYYTSGYERNQTQHLLGCGVPAIGYSSYGNKIDKISNETLLFIHDVGWAGFYFLFGLAGCVILLYILIKSMFIKTSKHYLYCKLFILSRIITSITSAPILYHYEILVIVTVLYLITIKEDDRRVYNYSKL